MTNVQHFGLIESFSLDALQANDRFELDALTQQFYTGVEELKAILGTGAILFVPTSMGKDSTCVTLMALEAYRQGLTEGLITPTHPLIFSTVNTGMEQTPMQLYVAYAKRKVEAYASAHGINLRYEIVKPPLNDQFFIRWMGSQKLLPHPK